MTHFFLYFFNHIDIYILNFNRAVENVQRKIIKQKNTLHQRMQYTYPVLSRIGPWMRDKQRIAEVKISYSFTL